MSNGSSCHAFQLALFINWYMFSKGTAFIKNLVGQITVTKTILRFATYKPISASH